MTASSEHAVSAADNGNLYFRAGSIQSHSERSVPSVKAATHKRKIGLLIDSMIGGGAERVVLNLAMGFRQAGYEPHVFLVRNEIQHKLPKDLSVHILSSDGRPCPIRALNKLCLAWTLRRTVRQLESDGTPFSFFISNAEDSDRISALAGLDNVFIRYRNSMVEYFHHKLGNKTGLKRLMRRLNWSRRFRTVYGDRRIITVSQALQAEIVDQMGIAPTSITTIYNPFDFENLRALGNAYPAPLDEKYIVYAAKFEKRKRQDVLLRAYASSKARGTHRLVLLGGTYTDSDRDWYRHVMALITELGLEDRVELPGFQNNPYPWIKHASLFAMASDSEGLPTVLIESLILGTPVVSTDCPTGPQEILTGNLAQFLCPRDDAPALSALIDRALSAYPNITDKMLQRFRMDFAIKRYLQHCAGIAADTLPHQHSN